MKQVNSYASQHSRRVSNQSNSSLMIHGKPGNNIQAHHAKKMSNRSVLREQNQKLKSEVHILQQALVNLSLNDITLKQNNQNDQQMAMINSNQTINSEQNNTTGQFQLFNNSSKESLQYSANNQTFEAKFLNDSQIQVNGGSFLSQQSSNQLQGTVLQTNLNQISFDQNYHQKLYQELLSQAQLNQSSFIQNQSQVLVQTQYCQEQNQNLIQNENQALGQTSDSIANILTHDNTPKIQSNIIQDFSTPAKQQNQLQQQDSNRYSSIQNREYIKQRVSNIIKDVTRGSNSKNQLSNQKENQVNHTSIKIPFQNQNLNDSFAKNSSNSPKRIQQRQSLAQSSSTSKQAKGFEITTNSSLHNSVFQSTNPQANLHLSQLPLNQSLNQSMERHQISFQANKTNNQEQIESLQQNQNQKYQAEIDNLKNILFEIGQKENEMIDKMNSHDHQASIQQQLTTQYFDAPGSEKENYYLKEIETKDQQLVEAQQHIETQDQEIESLQILFKELQMKFNSLQLECQTKQSFIENQQIKLSLLENEMQLVRQENQRLKQKPISLQMGVQTIIPLKCNAETNTDGQSTYNPYQTAIISLDKEKQLDFTLNNNNNNATDEKNYGNSSIASPKQQSSYMQTPTRSALHQFMYNSSAKKKDEFYSSNIFNKSSVIKEAINANNKLLCKNRDSIRDNSVKRDSLSNKRSSEYYSQNPTVNNLKCTVSNKIGIVASSLSNFITKPPQQNQNNMSLIQEEKQKVKNESTEKKKISRERRDAHLNLVSPDSKINQQAKQKNKQHADISLRCPVQRDTSCENKSQSDNQQLYGQRTPQNSKKANQVFQKASSILRQRYQTCSSQQSYTPVRQQRAQQPNVYIPGSNLSSHREQINHNSVSINIAPQLENNVVQKSQEFISNQFKRKDIVPYQRCVTSSGMINKSHIIERDEIELQENNHPAQPVNYKRISLQNYQTNQLMNASAISSNQVEEKQEKQNFMSVNHKIQNQIFNKNLQHHRDLMSPSSPRPNQRTKANSINPSAQQSQSAVKDKLILNKLYSQDHPIHQHSVIQQYETSQQISQAQIRKNQIEEERKKDLIKRIQAKEEKIQSLLEIKKQERENRETTYEERREKFKNEVKERRENLSKTPVKGRNQQGISTHQNSVHRKCVQNTNQTHNITSHHTEHSPMLTNQTNSFVKYDGQILQHQTSETPEIKRLSRKNTSEGRLSRKIYINQDEEDEAPLPLNVKISPVKNLEQFQYDM